MVAIDSNVLNYLLEATHTGQIPAAEPDVAEQQVAALRLFLWTNDLVVGRVVSFEAGQASDERRRSLLRRIIATNLAEREVDEGQLEPWQFRASQLAVHHQNGLLDCLLVAESEMIGADTLLTFDRQLIRRLADHTRLKLVTPAGYWNGLAIPRGTPRLWRPADSNPLLRETFWKWE